MLVFFLQITLGPLILGDVYDNLNGEVALAVFVFSSYLLGHLAFLLGSWILDDLVDQPIRDATYFSQLKNLSEGKSKSNKLTRFMANHIFKREIDVILNSAIEIKNSYFNVCFPDSAINAYQWCKARLGLVDQSALTSVQGYKADSKFFRSLVIVLLIIIPFNSCLKFNWEFLISGIVLFIFALSRYISQRSKSINQAYWNIITKESLNNTKSKRPKKSKTAKGEKAGGIVYKKICGKIKFLLVQSLKNCKDWVLPKGHIEKSEKEEISAVREVYEESGIWTRIVSKLGTVKIDEKNSEQERMHIYLMCKSGSGIRKENKNILWLDFAKAKETATFDDMRRLLVSAWKEINKCKLKYGGVK